MSNLEDKLGEQDLQLFHRQPAAGTPDFYRVGYGLTWATVPSQVQILAGGLSYRDGPVMRLVPVPGRKDYVSMVSRRPRHGMAPESLHLLLLGTCAMRCRACYGPKYSRRGTVSVRRWLKSFEEFWLPYGVRSVTISGGEPLLWVDEDGVDVEDLIVGLRELDPYLVITLSTIGRGRRKGKGDQGKLIDRPGIMQSANDLGLPLYGHTREIHGMHQLRVDGRPNCQGFDDVMEALLEIPRLRRPIAVEIRSVVTPDNQESLLQLPRVLSETGIDTDCVTWCLYEPNFHTGPRQDSSIRAEVELAPGEFEDFCAFASDAAFRDTDGLLTRSYPVEQAGGRYCFGGPEGAVTIEVTSTEPGRAMRVIPIGHIDRLVELRESFERLYPQVE